MDTYTRVIDRIPEKIRRTYSPAGAVCGNGDLAVIVENDSSGLVLCVSKCDFWKLCEGDDGDGGIKSVCTMRIGEVDLQSYRVEQRMKDGLISGKFGETKLELFAAPGNVIYFEISAPCGSFPDVTVSVSDGCGAKTGKHSENGCEVFTREFNSPELKKSSAVAVCLKELCSGENDGTEVKRFALSAVTSFDKPDYVKMSLSLNEAADYDSARAATKKKWNDFFSQSEVTLSDKELELFYHAGLYLLACCMGNRRFPPGLFGNFITDDNAPWHSDYHLNYNYEAPFYALFSSNHVSLSDCYMAPLYAFLSEAKRFATDFLGCRGVYFPVGIGPEGTDTSALEKSKEHGKLFLGQKSNALYAAVIPVMRWYAAYDEDLAREELYPFLSEVGAFWESYLKKENGRYVITDDAVHEVPYYRGDDFNPEEYSKEIHAKNNILSLGLVRMIFECLSDMAQYIEVENERRALWEDILKSLSDFPTFIKRGRRCYRYTEEGIAWVKTNSLCIQHIYPAGAVNLDSDKRTLKIARNTYFANDRRLDDNGSVSYLPCGARLGVSPEFLLDGIHSNIKKFALPNGLFAHGGGCLEHCATIPATVNEMLMQSCGGAIRLFPCWNKSDASFRDLRAEGAFLVSAEMRDGTVKTASVMSEKGRQCRLDASAFGCPVSVTDSDKNDIALKRSGSVISFETLPGARYYIIPRR